MIRGGIEYDLGIFVTGVDKDSVAERGGLVVCITYFKDILVQVLTMGIVEIIFYCVVSECR
jgi:hypothetical protein